MFRRKEEEVSTGSSNDVYSASANTAQEASGGAKNSENSQPGSSAASQPVAAASSSASSQTPQIQPVVRSISDIARAPAASPVSPVTGSNTGYRPAPVTDFSRTSSPSARGGQEPVRPGMPQTSTLSHSFPTSEKQTAIKTNPRILTVGNDILLKGEIATCDRVVIEGRVEAKLSDVHTVEIAGCGTFKGTAEVEDAEVSGVFEGDLAVRNRLVIYATGEVRGNVTYGEIEIERGGKLTGQIKTVSGSSVAAVAEKPNLLDVLDTKSRHKEASGS